MFEWCFDSGMFSDLYFCLGATCDLSFGVGVANDLVSNHSSIWVPAEFWAEVSSPEGPPGADFRRCSENNQQSLRGGLLE